MKTAQTLSPLKRLQQRKELLVILLFLFVIVLFWIALGIFSSQQTPGVTPEERRSAQPLTPALDATVIEKLEQKRMYEPAELADFPIITTPVARESFAGEVQAAETEEPEVVLPDELEGELQSIEQSF